MISLVIPSRNNYKYVKFAYNSIRKYIGKDVEVILLDDASTDDTWKWMIDTSKSDSNVKIYINEGPDRVGHTVLYDIGATMATNKIFGIFHADMVATPNYIKNMVKNLKPNRVVSSTRIEPPLHPPGPEKLTVDLGFEPEEFKENEFLQLVKDQEPRNADKLTQGVFAPWIMYVSDFQAIGGHDKRVFAPMELEDSDLFNRFLLAGYDLVQSRDAFVYHMTCRGSRFKDGIKIIQEIPLGNGQVWKRSKDSEEYTKLRQIKFREWWRKWHMDVLHDTNMLPIVYPRYDTGFIIKNCPYDLIQHLEPWCDTLYIESPSYIEKYIKEEQIQSKFDIKKRVVLFTNDNRNDIMIEFDAKEFNGNNHMEFIKQIPLIVKDSGEIGTMKYDIFTFDISKIESIEKILIHADNPLYINKLL